jgi:diguanylate cyclase (GGDEF)-like protein
MEVHQDARALRAPATDGPATDGNSAGPLLAGVRRLTLLADRADDAETIFLTLAGELLGTLGGEEVHVHHLAASGAEDEIVVIYMYDGAGRLSYLAPRSERAPGVSWVASTGRSFLASDARELAASVPRVIATGPAGSALLVPLAVRGETEAVIVLVRRRSEPFGERSGEAAETLVDQAATALALLRARAEAGTDAVTGCMNHRAMRRRLHEEIGRAHRGDSPLACLLIDLDDFKQINDRYGHPAGDAALRAVAQALMGEFRAFDRVARYGGDEFVVILPNADLESAAAAAGRAMARLARMPAVAGSTVAIKASVGVAQWQEPMTPDALLSACDAALLQSKRDGKGRVTRAA